MQPMFGLNFKKNNYFTDTSWNRERSEAFLQSRPDGTWLIRPTSTKEYCVSYSFNHHSLIKGEEHLHTLFDKYNLINEAYIGPQELIFEAEVLKNLDNVINEGDNTKILNLTKNLKHSILSNIDLTFSHCSEHPTDCKTMYNGLDHIVIKIQKIAYLKIAKFEKIKKYIATVKGIAQAFRELEKKTSILNRPLEEAMQYPGFILHYQFKDPLHEITHQLLGSFNKDNLKKVRMLFCKDENFYNMQKLCQVLARAISAYMHPINNLTDLTKDEIQGIFPYLSSIYTQVNLWEINYSKSYNIHKFLIKSPCLKEIKTDYPNILSLCSDKINHLILSIPDSRGVVHGFENFREVSKFSKLESLTIESNYERAHFILSKISLMSLKVLTIKVDLHIKAPLKVNFNEFFVKFPNLIELNLDNNFEISGTDRLILAEKGVQLAFRRFKY